MLCQRASLGVFSSLAEKVQALHKIVQVDAVHVFEIVQAGEKESELFQAVEDRCPTPGATRNLKRNRHVVGRKVFASVQVRWSVSSM
jgi:hypothetical protein